MWDVCTAESLLQPDAGEGHHEDRQPARKGRQQGSQGFDEHNYAAQEIVQSSFYVPGKELLILAQLLYDKGTP